MALPEGPVIATRCALVSFLVAGLALPASADPATAGLPAGLDVVQRVNERNEGVTLRRDARMDLIDSKGRTRSRAARMFRKYTGDDKKTTVFFTEPATIAGTSFLTFDYAEADRDDDQWLYLPAHRKVRRISATDRGNTFFGTDLSYEDVKKETKLAAEDYHWKVLGTETVDGHDCYVLEGIPVDEQTARDLGYSRVVSRIDRELWLTRLADYWDLKDQHLKTTRNLAIEEVGGFWTIRRTEVLNHRSGHRTVLEFSNIAYDDGVPDELFEPGNLTRGLP
jgi:outer membrane lipoprotein-sorting protein